MGILNGGEPVGCLRPKHAFSGVPPSVQRGARVTVRRAQRVERAEGARGDAPQQAEEALPRERVRVALAAAAAAAAVLEALQ